jgi:hypothetical protein
VWSAATDQCTVSLVLVLGPLRTALPQVGLAGAERTRCERSRSVGPLGDLVPAEVAEPPTAVYRMGASVAAVAAVEPTGPSSRTVAVSVVVTGTECAHESPQGMPSSAAGGTSAGRAVRQSSKRPRHELVSRTSWPVARVIAT